MPDIEPQSTASKRDAKAHAKRNPTAFLCRALGHSWYTPTDKEEREAPHPTIPSYTLKYLVCSRGCTSRKAQVWDGKTYVKTLPIERPDGYSVEPGTGRIDKATAVEVSSEYLNGIVARNRSFRATARKAS